MPALSKARAESAPEDGTVAGVVVVAEAVLVEVPGYGVKVSVLAVVAVVPVVHVVGQAGRTIVVVDVADSVRIMVV